MGTNGMAFEGSESLLRRSQDFVADHLKIYLESGGAQGHVVDVSHTGWNARVSTLLLRTFGRKSGKEYLTPLIYGAIGGEWIVIASKAGAIDHPAWYRNLVARSDVRFQVGGQTFDASWRTLEGAEREEVWAYMARVYPPFADYAKACGDRIIPVIAMLPESEVNAPGIG